MKESKLTKIENMKKEIRDKIIQNGVNNLREFGYENVNSENILTDEVYKLFFKSMLEDNLGYSESSDLVVKDLINEIK